MEDLGIAQLFNGTYKDKRVFITGHTGFKGSWLCTWLHQLGAKVTGFSLPEKTSPSHFEILSLNSNSYTGNILDKESITNAINKSKPDIVFHLAAQALVRDSYRDPSLTYETNVIGTLNVLEAIRNTTSVKALVNVTTDKVYENREWSWPYREDDILGGYDLYSSSKACSEILTASFRNSFFNLNEFGKKHQVLISTARAGNVIGGGDWAKDRLIPDMVRASIKNEAVEIRSPEAVRPWEHVLEPLSGYLLLGQKLLEKKIDFASSWNFGPDANHFLTVGTLLNYANEFWPEMKWVAHADAQNFHEAKILRLDCSKAMSEMKWKPVWDIKDTLVHTINWYKDFYQNNLVNTVSDLQDYIQQAKHLNHSWTR